LIAKESPLEDFHIKKFEGDIKNGMRFATFINGPEVAENSVNIDKLKHGEEKQTVV
jgi:hypothetical protein